MNYRLSILLLAATMPLLGIAGDEKTLDAMQFGERAVPAFALGKAGMAYVLVDAWGSVVRSGKCDAPELRLPELPRGCYRLKTPEKEFPFMVVREPGALERGHFSLDVAIRGMIGRRTGSAAAERYKLVRELLRQCSVQWIRGRFYPEITMPEAGAEDFSIYDEELRELSQGGVKTSYVISGLPAWLGKPEAVDPAKVYALMKRIAERYRGRVAVWEFWNEQDLAGSFRGMPWEFATLMKAAWLGLKAGDPEALVSAGSFCVFPLGGTAEAMFRNDLGQFTDIFNFHIYQPLKDYPAVFGDIRSFLKRHRRSDLPIWITENGTQAEGAPRCVAAVSGERIQDGDQEMIWAEFLPKGHVLLQSLGAAESFTFVLRRHVERNGAKEWGLLRHDFTGKPALNALAVLNAEIGLGRYEGELKLPAGLRGFLYRQPDRSRSAVVWSVSELDHGSSELGAAEFRDQYPAFWALPCAPAGVRAVNVFGTSVPLVNRNGKTAVPISKYPVYIHGLQNTTLVRLPVPVVPARSADAFERTIVLRGRIPSPGKIELTVYNFSDRETTVALTANAPIVGLGESLRLEPFGRWTRELAVGKPAANDLEIGGRCEDRPITRLVIPGYHLGHSEVVPLERALRPEFWRHNTSGAMSLALDAPRKELTFQVVFSASDRWIYPELDLADAGISLAGFGGLSFEIQADQTADRLSSSSLCYFRLKSGKLLRCNYNPSSGGWVENFVRFPVPGEEIAAIQIGMNPRTDRMTYRLRNIKGVK